MKDSEFIEFMAAARRVDILGVDTETNGQPILDGRGFAVGISIAFQINGQIQSAYFPFRHESGNYPLERQQVIKELVANAKAITCHNAKFDLASLATLGIYPTGVVYCSLVMAHMINEEWPSKELEWLSRQLLKDGKDSTQLDVWIKTFGWGSVPAHIMAPYAAKDAELHLRLWQYLWRLMIKEDLDHLWPIESEFLKLLNRIERRGIRIDTDRCRDLLERGNSRMDDIRRTLGFDPGSTIALGKYLLDELNLPVLKRSPKTGKPSFDKDVMAEYDIILSALDNPIAQMIVEYRGWQRSVTACFEGYPKLMSPDGRVRPNFKMHGTVTSRLSCEQPNLQQIPRTSPKPWNGEVVNCFIPAVGFRLWGLDYSQLELRIGTIYTRIPSLQDAFLTGQDPHQTTADATGLDRHGAKTFNFAALYGAGANKMGYLLSKPGAKVSEADGVAAFKKYHSSMPQVLALSRRAQAKANQQGYITMWTGRRRHFTSYRGFEYHKAFNALIQGGAAEVVKRAMLACRELESDDAYMVLTVHDSVVWEIREGMEKDLLPKIQAIMERTPDKDFTIPLKVDIKEWGT